MKVRFRPLTTWPGERHQGPRVRSQFTAGWGQTLDLLGRELEHIGASEVVVELALREDEIRIDGWPRASARPAEPGTVISFESDHGPLRYATDRFDRWQDNLRAIALGLEALRKVDRYGITNRGEQYTGWKQLGPGATAVGSAAMTREEAARFIGHHSEANESAIIAMRHDPGGRLVSEGYRLAAKKLHPDQGGDPALFRTLQQARDLLLTTEDP